MAEPASAHIEQRAFLDQHRIVVDVLQAGALLISHELGGFGGDAERESVDGARPFALGCPLGDAVDAAQPTAIDSYCLPSLA